MNTPAKNKPVRSWLPSILLGVVISGLLFVAATPNFVRSGHSKTNGIINILRMVDAAKMKWTSIHGYTNNPSPPRKISAYDLAPYFHHEKGQEPFTCIGLDIDTDGNLRNAEGVVFVINPLGIDPEVRFSKAFKLSDQNYWFFGSKIPKGTVMRFTTATNAPDIFEYILPGQESKPCKSLGELLDR